MNALAVRWIKKCDKLKSIYLLGTAKAYTPVAEERTRAFIRRIQRENMWALLFHKNLKYDEWNGECTKYALLPNWNKKVQETVWMKENLQDEMHGDEEYLCEWNNLVNLNRFSMFSPKIWTFVRVLCWLLRATYFFFLNRFRVLSQSIFVLRNWSFSIHTYTRTWKAVLSLFLEHMHWIQKHFFGMVEFPCNPRRPRTHENVILKKWAYIAVLAFYEQPLIFWHQLF